MSTASLPVWDVSPLSAPQARVYGNPTPRPRVQRLANSIMGRVRAYYLANPTARLTAPELGAILGLRVENCLAPRLSELVAEGWLVKAELADGVHGVAVHRLVVGPNFRGEE